MGSGNWSVSSFVDAAAARAASGTDTFAYSARAHQSGNLTVHPTLDPRGITYRESRDNAEHPTSNAVIIGLDVTGSMGAVVRGIHRDLPRLHELLLGHNYLEHPQICFTAVGDATCDQVPLQVGQFESDNRMDQHLENMILEGGGGGQMTESYELLFYFAGQRTAIDCWEKRKRKGYLFVIGDEMAYPRVSHQVVKGLFGGGLQADVPIDEAIAQAREKYHVFYVIPGGASHGGDTKILGWWQERLGADSVIKLADPSDTSEAIALAIGIREGVVTPQQGLEHIRKRGVVGTVLARISNAFGALMGKDDHVPTIHAPPGGRKL